MTHGHAAHSAIIRKDVPFGDPEQPFNPLGARLATRLGLEDRTLTLDRPLRSPFGQSLTQLSIPGWMARGIDATEIIDAPPETDAEGLRLSFGGKSFRYTRFGLEFDA